MYCIVPHLNRKIIVTDKDTGTSFDIWFYYDRRGKACLAFDVPDNIRIYLEPAKTHTNKTHTNETHTNEKSKE